MWKDVGVRSLEEHRVNVVLDMESEMETQCNDARRAFGTPLFCTGWKSEPLLRF